MQDRYEEPSISAGFHLTLNHLYNVEGDRANGRTRNPDDDWIAMVAGSASD
jgi:hypothetical protein